jgi:hypothetical protein
METNFILDLFGHSIYHPDLNKALNDFDAICKDKSKLERYDSIKSKSTGVTFTFWFKEFYDYSVETPKSTYRPENEDEVLLYEMTFTNKKGSNTIWPFGLNYRDHSDTVTNKIGVKPFSKSKNYDNEHTWTYYNDKFEIMPVFDDKLNLMWLRIWALKKSDKKKIELKENLKQQNKNISIAHIDRITELKKSKPTSNWRNRLNEGDSFFNNSNILESEIILDNFIDNLVIATKSKKASLIYSTAKKVTESFNKAIQKHNDFIDTMEREELVDFIVNAIKLTGFKIDNGVDITEDWRQW